jgi:biotin-(acetyl-CoA carboxylase) ligase
MMGRAVEVRFRDEVVSGEAVGLDDDGSLILQTNANNQLRVSAGDASIIKR